MSDERRDAPPSLNSLEARINNLARQLDRPVRLIQRVIANTVVGQMLPDGVVKGGTAMKLRVGEAGSRFTPDFDTSRSADVSLDDYVDRLADRLEAGWGGFIGTVERLEPPQPEGVPAEYVMQPFDVRLAYRGRHWLTVRFEIGRDEIGSTEQHDLAIAADIIDVFAAISLDEPAPVPVLALDHQIAQKLHACTSVNPKTGGNQRAHDLVDLQLLDQEEAIDMAAVGETAQRLFAARRAHEWPPTVVSYADWATIYAEAADGLGVIDNVVEAVAWANEFVQRAARRPRD